MNQIKNTGVILSAPKKTHNVYGSSTSMLLGATVKNWLPYIPEYERQAGVYFDTMACVTFSALNVLEIIYKFKYGVDINFADRFTAEKSGTTTEGNYLYKVGDSITSIDGFVLEQDWPFDYYATEPRFVWNDYYSPISREVTEKGLRNLKNHTLNYEWVTSNKFREAVQGAPIQVIVKPWNRNGQGLYYSRQDQGYVHAVVLLGYEDDCPVIFDHYEPFIKKLTPDYDFHTYGMRYDINRKNMIFYKEIENSAIYQYNAKGEYVPFVNAKAFTDLYGDFADHDIVVKSKITPKSDNLIGLIQQ